MTYCFPCARNFASAAALRQHLKTSATHPYCTLCDMGFQTDSGYLSHCKSKHAPECRPCHNSFRTWDELEEHWKTGAHPTCTKCDMGFEEYRMYTKHMTARHASTACAPCSGLLVPNEDLESHYRESPRHPSCATCHTGFANDASYAEHAKNAHTSTSCQGCSRQFGTPAALRDHFAKSPLHPTCPGCRLGFEDDDALAQHYTSCSQVASQPPLDTDVVDLTPTKLTPLTRTSRLRVHNSTPSEADLTDMVHTFMTPSPSPARTTHEMSHDMNITLPPSAFQYQNSPLTAGQTLHNSNLSPGKSSSDPGVASPLRHAFGNGHGAGHDNDNDGGVRVGASNMLRTGSDMSELDLATVSFNSPAAPPSIVFGHARDISPSPGPRPNVPKISVLDATLDLDLGGMSLGNDGEDDEEDISFNNDYNDVYNNDYNNEDEFESESDIGGVAPNLNERNQDQDRYGSRDADGDRTAIRIHAPRINVPEILRLRLAAASNRSSSVSSTSTSASIASIVSNGSNSSTGTSASNNIGHGNGNGVRNSLGDGNASGTDSGLSTPTMADISTPRSISPFPDSNKGSPFAYPFPAHDGVESSPKKTWRNGNGNGVSTVTGHGVSTSAPSPSAVNHSSGLSLLHCRACKQDPCEVPTATMCGHVFCKSCIEEAVIKNSKCPQCSQAVLLYCLWRLDLDS